MNWNDIACASVAAPGRTVEAVALLFDILTSGVPVTVKFVAVAVVQSDEPDPVQVI